MKIFLNGFGRIGRTVLRQILARAPEEGFVIAGINDIVDLETCAYLFRYDSVYGPYPHPVSTSRECLTVAGRDIPFTRNADISTLDLSGVDLVMECTGTAKTREIAERGLVAGASRVLISGPTDAADETIVLGANEDRLGATPIVSNSSCTTNAIAPLLKALDQAWGVAHGHITTIHCYTGSQPTVDAPGPGFARSRAAAVSMVPTTTSAAPQITRVLPAMADRLTVSAVRVPCISVSAVDAVLQIERWPGGAMEEALAALFEGHPVIGLTRDPCVSSDLRGNPASLVLALPETQVARPGQLRLLGWYDNEWGFSARMLDMAERMLAQPA